MTTIKLCDLCNGSGEHFCRGDRGEDDSIENCSKCAGTGRIAEISIPYDMPYIPEKVDRVSKDCDSKIHTILRESIKEHFKNLP